MRFRADHTIGILAGEYSEAADYARKHELGTPRSGKWIYANMPLASGYLFDQILIVGAFWKRHDCNALLCAAQERLKPQIIDRTNKRPSMSKG